MGRAEASAGYAGDALWTEGELLLSDPTWIERHLLGKRPAFDAESVARLRLEAGLSPIAGTDPRPPRAFASPARALLLAHHLRQASRSTSASSERPTSLR